MKDIQEILIKIYFKIDNKQFIHTYTYNKYKQCYDVLKKYKENKDIKYEGYKLYKIIERNINNYEI